MSPKIPENPGSLASFIAERTHHAVAITETELRFEYSERLVGLRRAIASHRGISLEDLHDGGVRQEKSAEIPHTESDDVQV